jgi:DNA-binding response OmpR family regulator/anti-sigma regulatory factor (Ser/Thr protein kinase)
MRKVNQRSENILIVDDNPANLQILMQLLDDKGYRIFLSESGESALFQAEQIRPDLILLDVRMPGIDGFETCRRLKKRESTRNIPVIFITALGRQEEKIEGFQAGAVDYVTKPFHKDEVLARIHAQISLIRQRRELAEARTVETMRTLIGGIAHVFNNKLFCITGNLELMQDEFGADPDIQSYIDNLWKPSDQMIRLTRLLLSYSVSDAGKAETLRISEVMSQAIDIVKYSHKTGGEIEFEIAPEEGEPAFVTMDESQLVFVVSSVLKNALEAMSAHKKDGIVRIYTTLDETARIEGPGADRFSGGVVHIRISDEGIGMEENTLRRAFDPFFSTKFQGRGMELPASLRITQNAGGEMYIESTPGRGTTVHILLPAAAEKTAASTA